MAAPNFDEEFLLVAKNLASVNSYLKTGVYLETKTGLTIDAIIEAATVDRFKLSERMFVAARLTSKLKPRQSRLVITRCYYAMYHAARSVVFRKERGDDHEAHAELPKHLPGDFPDRNNWENKIKSARLDRNRADYDPYPTRDIEFSKTAQQALVTAREFLTVSRKYLISKGCPL
jgi:uncharacterized protein (UPF0332 family)